MGDLVLLKNFATINEAEMAQDVLEQAGIHSVVQPGSGAGVLRGMPGAELFVLKDDLEKAREIIR